MTIVFDDFNDHSHRESAASALFQKGAYHLFIVKQQESDAFARVLRLYQCLFQLCSALLLLDDSVDLNLKAQRLQGPLRRRCADSSNPSRREIDPAAVLTHSTFDTNGDWSGFHAGHPLHAASTQAVALFRRVVEARHNLIYRPFLLASSGGGSYWEDCPLLDLIAAMPAATDVEHAYRCFGATITDQYREQREERERRLQALSIGAQPAGALAIGPRLWAIGLMEDIRLEYRDTRDGRPTETILLTYARMLNGDNQAFLDELRRYHEWLLEAGRGGGSAGNLGTAA